MKICVTSTGDNLGADVDPRFGRCKHFIVVDTETMKFKSILNPNINAAGGAGIQSAQLVAKEGVKAVVTGQVGPNAQQTLSSLGVEIYAGAAGKVSEAIKAFKDGKLSKI